MSMFKQVKRWLYGLLAGFIGGGASAVSSMFGPMFVDPAKFNFADAHGFGNILKTMGISFVVSGAISAFLYLKQAPLPPQGDDTAFITKPKDT